MGVRTRSGRKAFNTEVMLAKYTSYLCNKNTPTKRLISKKPTTPKKKSRRIPRKSYKFSLKKRIQKRKQEYGLKRASSRIAARYFLSEDMPDKRQDLFKKLYRMPRGELEFMLIKNNQASNGTKKELALRIAEGIMFGAAPKCDVCEVGHFDFDFGTGNYTCRGFYDANDDHVECNGRSPFQWVVNRVTPWKK